MRAEPIQTSFAGGELSRRLRGRLDLEGYRAGLARCADWQPTPQGSVRTRPGTRYASARAGDGRLFVLPVQGRHGYLVELNHQQLVIHNADGLLERPGQEDTGDSELVRNGLFADAAGVFWESSYDPDPEKWGEGGTGVVAGNYNDLHLLDQDVWAAKIGLNGILQQQVTVREAGAHRLRFSALWADASYLTVTVGTTDGGSDLYSITLSAATLASITNSADRGELTFEATITIPAGTPTVWIRFAQTLWSYPPLSLDPSWNITGVSLHTPTGNKTLFAPYLYEDLPAVQAVQEPERDAIIFLHPRYPPHVLRLDQYGQWTLQKAMWAGTPEAWNERSYPACGCIWQGRLWLSGAPGSPATIWASCSGEIYNLTVGANADDGLELILVTRGAVRWLAGQQALLVGTDRGEHSLSAQGGLVTPADFHVRDESAFGSADAPALLLGGQLVYLSRDARKLRAVSFDLNADAWASADLTFAGEHLTTPGVRELAFAGDPDGVILALLEDDTLACCSYDRGARVAAWWTLTLPATVEAFGHAQALAVAVSDGPDGSVAWLAVNRTRWTGTPGDSTPAVAMTIEALRFGAAGPVVDCAHVVEADDSNVFAAPGLVGQQATVAVNGVPLSGTYPVIDGDVTIPNPATGTVEIGVGFTPTLETLPPLGPQGELRRWPKVMLRLTESGLPLVNGETLDVRPGRSGPVEPVTGDFSTRQLGHDSDGQVTITQPRPIATEILAIFGVLTGHGV